MREALRRGGVQARCGRWALEVRGVVENYILGLAALRPSMTMQHSASQLRCQRQPISVPLAFPSIQAVACVGDSSWRHWGQRGDALAVKRPPQLQGRRNGSISLVIRLNSSKWTPLGRDAYASKSAVVPSRSQYA
jgi:hypothetical protein